MIKRHVRQLEGLHTEASKSPTRTIIKYSGNINLLNHSPNSANIQQMLIS